MFSLPIVDPIKKVWWWLVVQFFSMSMEHEEETTNYDDFFHADRRVVFSLQTGNLRQEI